MANYTVTRECVERFYTWVKVHCPCALEEPDFIRGLIVIADEEVKDALLKERKRLLDTLRTPSNQ